MTPSQTTFWATLAQVAPVIMLALVIEARNTYSRERLKAYRRTYKHWNERKAILNRQDFEPDMLKRRHRIRRLKVVAPLISAAAYVVALSATVATFVVSLAFLGGYRTPDSIDPLMALMSLIVGSGLVGIVPISHAVVLLLVAFDRARR